jgi:hypothetical protein
MNTSKIVTIVFFLLIGISIGFTYYKYVIQEDYMVKAQAPCDPYTESCFVAVCDPEEEECTGNVDEDTTYYKILYRNAQNIPPCDANSEEGCNASLTCWDGESECEIVACSPDAVEEGEECSNSDVYSASHPKEDPNTEEVGDEVPNMEVDVEPQPAIEQPITEPVPLEKL